MEIVLPFFIICTGVGLVAYALVRRDESQDYHPPIQVGGFRGQDNNPAPAAPRRSSDWLDQVEWPWPETERWYIGRVDGSGGYWVTRRRDLEPIPGREQRYE